MNMLKKCQELPRPRVMADFLRKADSLKAEEIRKMTRKIEDGEW